MENVEKRGDRRMDLLHGVVSAILSEAVLSGRFDESDVF